MSTVESLVQTVIDGPFLLAAPVAAAAGLVSFLSPCCLPLVPGYLSYMTGLTGLTGAELEATTRRPAPVAASAPARVFPRPRLATRTRATACWRDRQSRRAGGIRCSAAACCSCSVSRRCSWPLGPRWAASHRCCSCTRTP